jgi:uncharacterized membrane protein
MAMQHARTRRFRWAGYLLGFSLGGFFDGILLHQILQWHHLLSTINAGDMRFQVAADGYFHAFMYVVVAAGLWMLWRSWQRAEAASGRLLAATMLIGFGTWHMLDSVLSHWLLGIHRIRMDSEFPLMWDLIWFAVFGLLPFALGVWGRQGGDRPPGRPVVAASIATCLALGAGAQALQPPQDAPVHDGPLRAGHAACRRSRSGLHGRWPPRLVRCERRTDGDRDGSRRLRPLALPTGRHPRQRLGPSGGLLRLSAHLRTGGRPRSRPRTDEQHGEISAWKASGTSSSAPAR